LSTSDPGPRGAAISPQFKPILGPIDRRVGRRPPPRLRCLRVCPAQQAAGKMLEQSPIGHEEDDNRSLADEASTPEGATHA
jgi:hypothetical protein